MQRPYILVSGAHGAGKTRLVQDLSSELGLETLLEHDADNPYLDDFYVAQQDHPGLENPWALRSQLWYLVSGLRDLRVIQDRRGGMIQERSMHEDFLVYAHELRDRGELVAEDFTLLSDLYYAQADELPRPDLLLYLEATTSDPYLQALQRRYQQFLDGWLHSPVLRLRSEQVNVGQTAESILEYLEGQAA